MWQDHILSITVFSTLWWYIYAAYDLMYGAEGKGFFRNISDFTLLFLRYTFRYPNVPFIFSSG